MEFAEKTIHRRIKKIMTDEHFTPVRTGALSVLLRVTAAKTTEFPVSEQIRIYHALSEALPDGQQKLQARELGRVLSRAEALQLEFQQAMKG